MFTVIFALIILRIFAHAYLQPYLQVQIWLQICTILHMPICYIFDAYFHFKYASNMLPAMACKNETYWQQNIGTTNMHSICYLQWHAKMKHIVGCISSLQNHMHIKLLAADTKHSWLKEIEIINKRIY